MSDEGVKDSLAGTGWESWFSSKILARGRGYAAGGRVLRLMVTARGSGVRLLEAEVAGSNGNIYQCSVTIDCGKDILDADCSCPVESYCKHAAALLYVAQAEAAQDRQAPHSFPAPDTLQARLENVELIRRGREQRWRLYGPPSFCKRNLCRG